MGPDSRSRDDNEESCGCSRDAGEPMEMGSVPRSRLGDRNLLFLGDDEGRGGTLVLMLGGFRGVRLLGVLLAVPGGAECHEDQREEGEDEGLNEADEELQEVERDRADDRQQEVDDEQQHVAGEDVAEETEAEREDAQRLEDQLKQADDEAPRAVLQREQTAQLPTDAEDLEAIDLRGDDGDDR